MADDFIPSLATPGELNSKLLELLGNSENFSTKNSANTEALIQQIQRQRDVYFEQMMSRLRYQNRFTDRAAEQQKEIPADIDAITKGIQGVPQRQQPQLPSNVPMSGIDVNKIVASVPDYKELTDVLFPSSGEFN